ncbi:hemerythrin domain-containing protein [Blastococcus sp. SYSU D00820]
MRALGDELRRIHDTLRADLRALQKAVRSGDPPERRRPLATHCAAFCAALTRHHTGEDAGAFPALAQRFPELVPLLLTMAEDHAMISGIVARVEELAGRLAAGAPAGRLAGELDGLAAVLESHFSFEERRIQRALDALPPDPALLGAE